ncbi:DUF2059 domain-containing protein [Massilia sp. 9I]|uniref:DUF2059 domain-containing protein n=1 Tax=Massilia sp. 9I TaxID=2653152 RepID=UPI0012F27613|nr:DUF2059 domain-containing protein [Massilia sp. 9I]VXB25161.1 conserved exported hypothetical protein [Massilia sp. 9I]
MKKFVLSLATAAAFAATPAFAQTAPSASPQTTAAAKAMIDAMEIRKSMVLMYAEMQKSLPGMMRQQIGAMIEADASLNAAQKKEAIQKFEAKLPGMAQAVGKVFSDPALIDEMIAEMVPLYANNYTVDEIKTLTAFYQSPVGRKMMTLMPKLAGESMAIGQRVMNPRIGKLMQDVMQEVQKQ